MPDFRTPMLWALCLGLAAALLAAGIERTRVADARADAATAREELAGYRVTQAESARMADRAQRTEEQRRQAVVDQEAQDANTKLVQARADAVIANAAAGKLRDQLAAYFAAVRRASQEPTPTAGGAGQPGADPLDLLAQLYGRTDDAAGAIGQYADDLAIRGAACERTADGLQPPTR